MDNDMLETLRDLTLEGVLGFYNIAEITEIIATDENRITHNVFTLIVLEYRNSNMIIKPHFLGERINLGGQFKRWTFGIIQYTVSIEQMLDSLSLLTNENNWNASGKNFVLGDLKPKPYFFVPPDFNELIPINNVLKNNFFNGSYVFEWYDNAKSIFDFLFKEPPLLQKLSEKIQKYIPIKIASLSDRLGNIILQVPVNIIHYNILHSKQRQELLLDIIWHPKAVKKSLFVLFEENYDQTLTESFFKEIAEGINTFKLKTDKGPYNLRIFDEKSHLLAAKNKLSYIKYIGGDIFMQDPEPRIIEITVNGVQKEERILLQRAGSEFGVGDRHIRSNTDIRIYTHEKKELKERREFIQYKPKQNAQDGREQALEDLRHLIDAYGRRSVYLWDPFLSPEDIVNILFYCRYFDSDMKAITALDKPHAVFCPYHSGYFEMNNKNNKSNTILDYRNQFLNRPNNFYRGIKLEFRAKFNKRGWTFHDRFLIFPDTRIGVLAWSLGTSLNSLGLKHHILQKVGDGQMILDAFNELWKELEHPDNIIWKSQC